MTVEVESKLIDMMNGHFKDDHESFNKIDKAFDKQTEIAKQNGEHFSYFNKTLIEIKKTLEKDAEETTRFRDDMTKHIARVEPVIKAYEDEKTARKYLDEKGETVIKWSTRIGAVGIIGSALLFIIRKFL